jgi:hypothetical protein
MFQVVQSKLEVLEVFLRTRRRMVIPSHFNCLFLNDLGPLSQARDSPCWFEGQFTNMSVWFWSKDEWKKATTLLLLLYNILI